MNVMRLKLNSPGHATEGIFLAWTRLLISAPGFSVHQEKEKLYVELKHILARQPGPEAAEQLHIYRHTLREKTKQLKVSGGFCSLLSQRRPHFGAMYWTILLP